MLQGVNPKVVREILGHDHRH
jgi:hypothetical protein